MNNIMNLIQARLQENGLLLMFLTGHCQEDHHEEEEEEMSEPQVIVTVQYFPEEDVKTYNVHRKTGDFVIGEAGKIDLNNGQTLEVTQRHIFQ